MVKTIPSAQWNPSDKIWTFSKTKSAISRFVELARTYKFEGNVVPNYAFGGSTRREATRPDILGALAEGGPNMENLIAESQIKNLLADASCSS